MEDRELQRRAGGGFCSCFSEPAPHVGPMSLNRSEQRIFDYLQGHPDERHYWINKVQTVCGRAENDSAAVGRLESELWRYYEERSAVANPFKEAARVEGLKRTSMKNLAELLVRLWVEPKPRKKEPTRESG
ncbi:MAG: hypothetical protein Q7S40_00590 [Opitutaceae bacterium]|nr:hypothetical protein [Opitutaceae bacterium]